MKTWLRRALIAAAVTAAAYGFLFEYATHVGRGWLNGEAFYQGRPTSYWRVEIEDWVARFDSPEEAEQSLDFWSSFREPPLVPRATFGGKVRRCLGLPANDQRPPAILESALRGGDDVLRELERDPALRGLVAAARRWKGVP